ncbi:hypothetical protein PN462_11615 [Spirulina sp. CS-785/01]|uniref:hypothetical protein n=1 Tax=Spirulina sp. CS-785/01 TaxID=3021716 RepID=UPI00232EED88|nr:hypothetical protein [Spirulina sp. CS-785/01]MDB9313749.1 hypothetical protein [Spirulina sp. CS-785/01]
MSASDDNFTPDLGDNASDWVLTVLAAKLEETRKTHQQWYDSQSRAIAALTDTIHNHRKTELDLIQANGQAINDLIHSLDTLQTQQISVTRIITEKQQIMQDFKSMIQEIIAGRQQYEQETTRQIQHITQQMATLQTQFIEMQKEVFSLLDEVRHSQ